jgi:endoglucanase
MWQMDFSAFSTPGEYVISVDGIGCSFPFAIGPDVYRQAFITTARALYHQRCGVELKQPFTKWVRPACHRPEMRPFLQTSHRYMDKAFSDGPPEDFQVPLTGEERSDVWGGYHDAGDWDREGSHLEIADMLLLAYELAPQKFRDGELNIPESGNGIADIVDEARWGVDYYKRIQRPDGGVSVGFFESSWPKGGETSYTDSLSWYMYAEEPLMSYRYAAAASRLAWCLKLAGKDSLAAPYSESARKAWEWAGKNMREGDEAKVRDDRLHAAAALYKSTGEATYHEAFKRDLLIDKPDTMLHEWSKRSQEWGAWTYAATNRPDVDQTLKQRLVQASLHYAQVDYIDTAQKRGGRYGYNFWVPMWWGAATHPRTVPLMVAHHLSRDERYLAPQYTTCDYMLGGNPLNMVWVTGLGERHPRSVMHFDSWYDNIDEVVPGIVPMGPFRYQPEKASGPWLPAFAQATTYPEAVNWPPHELWFENKLSPPTNEFTVGGIAGVVAAYGALCADLPAAK